MLHMDVVTHNSWSKQKGFTLLELLTVIGIMLVLTTFVTPVIGNWRIERNIEKDFYALVGAIDYVKAKTRVVNGTAILNCQTPNNLTYTISDFRQTTTASMDASYTAGIIETKNENILSGDIFFNCVDDTNIIFLANGRASSWSGELAYQVSGITDKANFSAYKVTVNSATAFVQKYKWNKTSETWNELR
ncbi:type II secretion system protein [Methylophilaceae bacterium]|nr:type II secretion system protein [Methylophilaceae bacterium]